MQPEPKQAAAAAQAEEITICPNCHVAMPRALRFCRSCGFRLGEGIAEYTETVRLPNRPTTSAQQASTANAAAAQTGANTWAPITPVQPLMGQASAFIGSCSKKQGRKRTPWIVWVVLGITVASVTGGGLMSPFGLRNKARTAASRSATRSYVGVNRYAAAEGGGITFESVTPPGSAADKAGLIGGDIIKTFDGQTLTSTSQFENLLAATPIGKTVEVTYVRDGETKTTQLTTISKAEQDRLASLFASRPEGQGFLGIEEWDRVAVPGMNIYGVQLTDISKNRPGYIAGLREGDIVIEFNGTPIRTERELVERIERAIPDSTVKVVVIRGSERLEIPVKIGVDD
ncbi:MAG TPA: PDZ domain-containing protein [Pyrinomonadaceae bacterium]|jgi:membrane-associated protease RseP (regulator of RpoE activity)|nr:PDZ domain-containing protein [Pyrinomonadaceae bacterium]